MRPQYLYKYMSAKTAAKVLRNRTLRWSTPFLLNDPFDVQIDLRLVIDRISLASAISDRLYESFYTPVELDAQNRLGRYIRFARGRLPRLTREQFSTEFNDAITESVERILTTKPTMDREVREFMAKTKLLCLTVSPDNKLMWAHYAQNHTGVVLRFQSAHGVDSPWRMAEPIRYVKAVPEFATIELLADLCSGRRSSDPKKIMESILYTKSSEWAHEREWRLVSGHGRNHNADFEDIQFHRRELSGLIFGLRTAAEDKKEICDIIRGHFHFVDVLEAQRVQDSYELKFFPVCLMPW